MGVNKLWTVLRPAARTVKLDSLKHRRLAIDASIWLTSFVKAMRDANGDTIHNAHLKGLWGRLCKLLFFGMKPVFVFDGAPPILKAETLLNRRRARMKAESDLQHIAERILLNQLKLSTISQAKALLKEGKLQLSDIAKMGLVNALDSTSSVESGTNMDVVEVEEEPETQLEANVSDLDNSLVVEDETAQFVSQFTADELRSIETDGEFFQELPREVQLALLSEMKAAHRGHVGKISLTSPKRLSGENYSNLQVEQLVHRGGISRRLESMRSELDQDTFKPIASDPRVKYRLTTTPPPTKSSQSDGNSAYGTDISHGSVRVVLGPQFAAVATPSSTSSHSLLSSSNSNTTVAPEHTPGRNANRTQSLHSIPSSANSKPSLPQRASSAAQTNFSSSIAPYMDPDLDLILLSDDNDDEANGDSSSDEEHEQVGSTNDSNAVIGEKEQMANRGAQEEVEIEDSFEDVIFEDVSNTDPSSTQIIASSSPHISASEHSYEDVSNEDEASVLPPSPPKPIAKSTLSAVEIMESDDETIEPGVFGQEVEGIDEPLQSSPLAHSSGTPSSEPHIISHHPPPHITIDDSDHNSQLEEQNEHRPLDRLDGPLPGPSPSKVQELSDIARIVGVDLDMSTESHAIASVNQSLVSEEEMQRVSLKSFDSLEEELQKEVMMLQGEARQGQHHAATLTSEAVDEAKELLRLFGIPFVQSPSEADAQCAILQNLGLVDGIVSDDSDILVFGGDTVFRYAFSQHHELELYNMEVIESELGLDHDSLVFLALLLGGDYADGLAKIGPKAALDIVHEFPGPNGMLQFKTWLLAFQQDSEDYDIVLTPPSAPFVKRYTKILKSLKLPDSFPHPSVVDAYQNPSVDASKEPFSWGWPNLAGLRQFALDKFGWTKDRVDANIVPIIQRYTAALSDKQPIIETFFTQTSIQGRAPTKNKKRKSASPTPKKRTSADTSHSPELTPEASKPKRRRSNSKAVPDDAVTTTNVDEEEPVDTSLPPSKRYKRRNFDDE